jgi:hypothetical protein
MFGEVECFGEVNEEGGETKWMDNDPRLGAFDELLRTSMDISNRQTRLFNEAKDKGYQRGYFLQLAGRLLGREMMILGLRFGNDCCHKHHVLAPRYLSS